MQLVTQRPPDAAGLLSSQPVPSLLPLPVLSHNHRLIISVFQAPLPETTPTHSTGQAPVITRPRPQQCRGCEGRVPLPQARPHHRHRARHPPELPQEMEDRGHQGGQRSALGHYISWDYIVLGKSTCSVDRFINVVQFMDVSSLGTW